MQILTAPITCGNKTLAEHISIPETILEKFIGLRRRALNEGEAMLWYFKKPQVQLFDTLSCLHPIGYLALDKNGKVLQKGIMEPSKAKFVKCSYWIEFLPEAIDGVVVGDKIEGLNNR